MKILSQAVYILTLLVFSSFPVRAQILAIQSADLSAGVSGLPDTTFGWAFTVGSSPISVTELGYYDYLANGLSSSHQVGIWDTGANLLTQATVPSGSTARLETSFRFTSITPVTLNANETYYIGGYSPPSADDALAFSIQTISSDITFLSHAYYDGTGFSRPDTLYGTAHGVFGPNFSYSVVPEPREYAFIAGLGLAAFFLVRKRMQRRASAIA